MMKIISLFNWLNLTDISLCNFCDISSKGFSDEYSYDICSAHVERGAWSVQLMMRIKQIYMFHKMGLLI